MVDYLLTKNINQDCLENFFSLLRSFGTSHPGPVDVMQKIKLILVGANPKNALSVSNPSVEMETPQGSEEKNTEFVSSLISSQILDEDKQNEILQPGIILLEDQVKVQTLDQLGQLQKKSANEAVSYIAGYIAKNMCNKVEGLISETTTSSWIKLKNQGSLFSQARSLWKVFTIMKKFLSVYTLEIYVGNQILWEEQQRPF
ncbi:uncharacterized protein LOC111705981 [Eurytemora carolleeae]|uniref:uncharacterized protein LOC111705981 n=1 Tax=Eurytemora carolleeae TaxID=1294199 RepID=UPI000C771C97|nr:uncharacterized protein LOC111705981 [Eurytemora carolleeae]|eukprot:XP_023334476.1 uncharacterized protein LOC111705981 [Eurytemora affinis]